LSPFPVVGISAKEGTNLHHLLEEIKKLVFPVEIAKI